MGRDIAEAPEVTDQPGLTLPGEPVRALLIVNPQAGPGLWAGAQPAAQRLQAAGWHVDTVETDHKGHAVELARLAVARGYHLVIGCGGDGTLNEVVQGLVGSATALGIIPMGTANVLARDVGIPLDPVRAAEALLTGRVRVVDVGRAGDRAFIMMAGIGLDADVVQEVEQTSGRPLRWLKAPRLFWGTVRRFFTYQGTRMRLALDDQRERGRVMMVVVGNIRSYAGLFQITHEADWDDGLLDVVVFYSGGFWVKIGNLISVLRRRHRYRQGIAYHRVRQVRVWAARPVPVQADGDLVGATPMTFTIEPRALRVVLPGLGRNGMKQGRM
jgi:diacylglycerol kinase (ATP)